MNLNLNRAAVAFDIESTGVNTVADEIKNNLIETEPKPEEMNVGG